MNKETKNIAVFIDVENIDRHRVKLDILINKLKEKGRLIVRKAYADWGQFPNRKREMLENSIELIELPSHSGRGKNSADIKLVVDALETVFTKEHIDTYTVISGDSDYIPLISKLREYNKYVIVIAYDPTNTNPLIKNYCDELMYYSSIAGIETVKDKDLNLAYELLIRTINVLEKEGLQRRGSQVKQYMKLLDSSFDESNFGFSQFKYFLKSAEQAKIIVLQEIGEGDHLITLTEENSLSDFETFIYPIEQIEYLIFWAMKANFIPPDNKVLMGTLNETIKKFNSDFNIANYGISKTRGFKGFIEYFFEQKGLLEIELNEKNETWLTLTPTFENFYNSSEMPDNFQSIRIKILLSKLGLSCTFKQIEKFIDVFRSLLEQSHEHDIILANLLEQTTEKLSDPLLEDKLSPSVCQKIINIFMKNQNLKDSEGNAILELSDKKTNIYLDSTEKILQDFKHLISIELKREFNENIGESEILHCLA